MAGFDPSTEDPGDRDLPTMSQEQLVAQQRHDGLADAADKPADELADVPRPPPRDGRRDDRLDDRREVPDPQAQVSAPQPARLDGRDLVMVTVPLLSLRPMPTLRTTIRRACSRAWQPSRNAPVFHGGPW